VERKPAARARLAPAAAALLLAAPQQKETRVNAPGGTSSRDPPVAGRHASLT
jgi:hypothetical protein